MLGFEALAALPLSTLPAEIAPGGGSSPAAGWWYPAAVNGPRLGIAREDEEIIFLRRKTSSKAGV